MWAQVIATRQVAELPLNGRNFMQIGIVTKGVIVNSSAENGRPAAARQMQAGLKFLFGDGRCD
jgi:hypothetical protein